MKTGISFLADTYLWVQQRRVACDLRRQALEKNDESDVLTLTQEELLRELEEKLAKQLGDLIKDRPVYTDWLSQVKGISPRFAALIIGGFESALKPGETLGGHFGVPSQMWGFSGLSVGSDGKAVRRKAGEKVSFAVEFRSMLLGRVFPSLMKACGGYFEFAQSVKKKEAKKLAAQGIKIVPTAKLPKKNGKIYEPEGMMALGHFQNRVRRKVMKLFVSHFWEGCRKAEGLPAGLSAYAFAQMHHDPSSYIAPIRDRDNGLKSKKASREESQNH